MTELDNRRPLKSRNTGWARTLAAALARAGISPDLVSAGSVVFAALGAAALVGSGWAAGGGRSGLLLAGAACVQLRLLCNLLDGMVAVEHGRGGLLGPIWNELPDRVADILFLAGAGYGAAIGDGHAYPVTLGWAAAAMAVLTAYVRELGRGLGHPADFSGPVAKPQRMALLTLGCLLAAAEPLWGGRSPILAVTLLVIACGSAWTAANRTVRLARRLRAG